MYFKKSINLVNSEEGECHECGNVNPEQIFNIIETKVINEYGHFTDERKISSTQWNAMFRKNFKAFVQVTFKGNSTLNPKHSNTVETGKLFSMRDLQAKIHNQQYMIINLLEAPVLAFILAFIVRYYNTDDSSSTDMYLVKIPIFLPIFL